MKKYCLYIICIFLFLSFILMRCGKQNEKSFQSEVVGGNKEEITLVLATFGENPALQEQVEQFQQNHTGYKIEIRQYDRFEQEEWDGIARLQREIVSGKGPDIINFGYGYSVTDILGKYTEDLYPYFDATSLESSCFSNILQAFSYQDGLYAMPVSFSLKTFVGRRTLIGDRESWNIEEMIECYETELEKSGGSLMLYPGEIKKDVFGSILIGSVENYVDWEMGTCKFNEDEFKKIMQFANRFPDTLTIDQDFSPMECFGSGDALLYPMTLNSIYDICKAEMILRGEPVYIGYPVCDADGTVIQASDLMLAISSVSEHKDVAWEFISQFLTEEYQLNITSGFPLNKAAFEKKLELGLTVEYTMDMEGNMKPVVQDEIIFEGEDSLKIYQITEEEGKTLLRLIEKASIGSAFDNRLHVILLEEVDSYFSGDKTLEEAAGIMQGRAQMYVGEF